MVGSWMATAFMLVLSLFLLITNRQPWACSSRVNGGSRKERLFHVVSPRRITTRPLRHWGFQPLTRTCCARHDQFRHWFSFPDRNLYYLHSVRIVARYRHLRCRARRVTKYLLYLLPLVTIEVFPATMLIAAGTYALLAKRSEAVAWWACGQSVYRLMLPGLIFALTAAAGAWLIQEKLMPASNIQQDALRAQIRGAAARAITRTGRQWLASSESNRLYSYEYDEQHQLLRDLTIYDFDSSGVHLTGMTSGQQGSWTTPTTLSVAKAEALVIRGLEMTREQKAQLELKGIDAPGVFKPGVDKPSQLSSRGLKDYLTAAKRRGLDVSSLAVALQRKYAEPFSILVMAFLGIPLALSFGRRGTVIALCSAVAVSLAYWGIGGAFQQLGNHGLLPPAVAGWAPPIIFAAGGTYFLSRIRT